MWSATARDRSSSRLLPAENRPIAVLTCPGNCANGRGTGAEARLSIPALRFRLPDGSVLSPDAAWVANEALHRLTPKQRKEFLPLCPAFAVEVRSPSDDLKEAKDKMQTWIANGAQLAWLIDGDARTVYVYRIGPVPRTRRGIAELAGQGPVKGFVLKLEAIWRGLA